jgi:hypothetical protein
MVTRTAKERKRSFDHSTRQKARLHALTNPSAQRHRAREQEFNTDLHKKTQNQKGSFT